MHIIATIGPKTMDKYLLKELIDNGVTMFRLNCSHFNEKEFDRIINYTREISENVYIIADLCGKKIRVSEMLSCTYKILIDEEVYFCGEDFYSKIEKENMGDMKLIPLTVKAETLIISDIKNISIKDETINFEILEKKQGIIRAKVVNGGIIRSGKGCNIPDIDKSEEFLSSKDKLDIDWALSRGVDIICQSYVDSKNDIDVLNKYIKIRIGKNKKIRKPKIWAKVETRLGMENLNSISNRVDAVVIGRGDLVPECGILNSVDLQQKAITDLTHKGSAIIIATHLLNSMKNGEKATLPEIESIYTFVKNGVYGFMLAGETSIGKTPIKTVKFLKEAIIRYEKIEREE